MRQADTAAHTERDVGVTAHYHNFILPLPVQPLRVSVTDSVAQTLHASKHAYKHIVKRTGLIQRWCQYTAPSCDSLSGCWMNIVKRADRNKHISYKNSGNASLSIWAPQHKKHMMLKAVHRVSWACTSVYTWLIGAGTETRSRYKWHTNGSTFQQQIADSWMLKED